MLMTRTARLAAVCLAVIATAWPADLPRPAGPLEMTAMDGRNISLADLKGKPAVVMYFSTDCPHCQTAATAMAPVYREAAAQGIKFVGLALNPSAEGNLGAFVDRYQVAFPVAMADRTHFSRFTGLSVMTRFYYPYIVVLDANGVIQEEHDGSDRAYYADLGTSLRESLAKLAGGS